MTRPATVMDPELRTSISSSVWVDEGTGDPNVHVDITPSPSPRPAVRLRTQIHATSSPRRVGCPGSGGYGSASTARCYKPHVSARMHGPRWKLREQGRRPRRSRPATRRAGRSPAARRVSEFLAPSTLGRPRAGCGVGVLPTGRHLGLHISRMLGIEGALTGLTARSTPTFPTVVNPLIPTRRPFALKGLSTGYPRLSEGNPSLIWLGLLLTKSAVEQFLKTSAGDRVA